MAAYMAHQHPDAAASAAIHGGTVNGGFQPHYHPQDPLVGNHAMMVNGGRDDVYLAPTATMLDGSEYGTGAFVPLPQAPRLPVAAARASSMAAMYYDPSLHPQHAYSNIPAPWSANYFGNASGDYNAVPPFHHQHVEQQLMLQNQLTKLQQPVATSAAPSYPAQYSQLPAVSASGAHPSDYHDLSAPPPGQATFNMASSHVSNLPWDQRWSGARDYHPVHAMPVGRHSIPDSRPHSPGGFAFPNTQGYFGTTEAANFAQNRPSRQWSYPHGPEDDHRWYAQQQDAQQQQAQQAQQAHFAARRNYWPWHATHAQDAAWSHAAQHQQHQQAQHQWQQQQQGAFATSNQAPLQAPPGIYEQRGTSGVPALQASDGVVCQQTDQGTALADANAQKKSSAPAPPSPETLDKSAVPTSLVGAEIIWLAAAALLDHSLWLQYEPAKSSVSASRRRMPSHASSSGSSLVPTPFTSPLSATNEEWSRLRRPGEVSEGGTESKMSEAMQKELSGPVARSIPQRLANDPYDESSASSSEPGTPPTSVPSRIWEKHDLKGSHIKRGSLGALHGMRSLGLSNDDARSIEVRDTRSVSPTNVLSPHARSFQRSSSYDRAREVIAGVTDLLKQDWRWSLNDDKLDSLLQPERREARSPTFGAVTQSATVAPLARRVSSGATRHGREDTSSCMANGHAAPGTEPSPAFRRFTHQVLSQTLVSPTAFMLGLMYSLRVLHLAILGDSPATSHLDPEAAEIFAQPPSAAPFKLLTLGLMIANKHLDDNTFLNKTWNEVTGISLSELNRAERWYLEKCSYEITVPEDTWVAFLEQLRLRTEQRITTLTSAKRIRVPTKQSPDGPCRSESYVVPHAGSEEAHKRFLFGAEEALQVLGRTQVFDLTDVRSNVTSRHHTQSPLESLPHKTHEQEPESRQSMMRPNGSLTNLHQHCHSAPVVGIGSPAEAEGDVDIFDDEDGPYRPRSTSIRRSLMNHAESGHPTHSRSSLIGDTMLSRSISDGFTPTASCAHEEQRTQSRRDSLTDKRAPLAPSVLLDLLNRGQHLAHAAH